VEKHLKTKFITDIPMRIGETRPLFAKLPMRNDTKATIKAFLSASLRSDLREDEDLFRLGFVKSLVILQLILFVERTFGITIENVPRDIDSFRTVNAIAALVERKIVYFNTFTKIEVSGTGTDRHRSNRSAACLR